MNWIEVISIRLSKQEDVPKLLRVFHDIKAARNKPLETNVSIKLYQNKNIESDWTIYLCQESPGEQANKTPLGHAIIEAIRPFGLMNHSVWKSKGSSPYKDE